MAVTLKDISFDLKPSDTDGLAVLVDRLQIDQLPKTRQHFLAEPYLRRHVRNGNGWIDIWPNWIVARLLSICLGPDMDENDALEKINGPIGQELKRLACRDLPVLEFYGTPLKGSENRRPVWKIKSKPAAWIAELRQEIRVLAGRLGFTVQGLIEPENEVHICIRGRYENSGNDPALPATRSDFCMTFHKVGFRRRFEYGTGQSEQFGSMLSVNFGTSAYVTSGGSRHIQFLSDITDNREFPSASDANRPIINNVDRLAASMAAQPPILELHESTTFPLESDVEVAEAASLREADRVAAPHNARVCREVAQSRLSTEPLVLLKVSRDPDVYHKELGTCAELQKCREDLEAAGKNFQLPSGAKSFVHPWQHDAALKAAELKGGLNEQHVLVSKDHEADVMKVIQRIPCNSKVRVRRRTWVPLGLASEAASSAMKLTVNRTFIHIDVPSSLRSSVSGQACVASTTEAHNGKNPRRA